jgi:hypothetical protein
MPMRRASTPCATGVLGPHWFLELDEAREKVEEWRTEYNERPRGASSIVSAILKIAMGQPRNEKPARRTLSHLSGRARRLEKYVWKNAWNALIQYNRLSQVHGIPAAT